MAPPYRILLVDDEPAVLSYSERLLTKLGYQVIANSSGEDALELYKELPSQFDLVISDFRMATLNGVQLSQEIHKITPEMPVIICSGDTSEFGSEDAEKLGVKWFIRKPLLKKDFATLVEMALGDKS
jgi:DNA-binding NtrC family response regulator